MILVQSDDLFSAVFALLKREEILRSLSIETWTLHNTVSHFVVVHVKLDISR